MWHEAVGLFEAHRATLARSGIALRARLEADGGLLCSYADGIVRLALPDPSLPGGALRAMMIASLLDLEIEEVVWMFRAQLARLVGHEIGHALRAEHGTTSHDPWAEEQAAERFGNVLCRPYITAATRVQLCTTLGGVVARIGGLREAATLHRARRRTMELPEVLALPAVDPPGPAAYRDLTTFVRLAVAWGYLDLLLDEEDDLDACCHDLLLAA